MVLPDLLTSSSSTGSATTPNEAAGIVKNGGETPTAPTVIQAHCSTESGSISIYACRPQSADPKIGFPCLLNIYGYQLVFEGLKSLRLMLGVV